MAVIDMVSVVARTRALANRYLVQQMGVRGLEGLVTSHGDVLLQLFAEDGLPMRELAARVHRDPSTVTTLVKKLADAGYVRTERGVRDRRSVVVLLTERGRVLERDFQEISQCLLEVQRKGIDDARMEAAREVLLQMQQNFAAALDAGSEERHGEQETR